VKPGDVTQVHASVGVTQASMLRNHAPVTGLEAKFSLEFAVASALVARKVGLRELTDKFVAQPQVRELMTRVRTSTTDTHCPVEPIFALTDRAAIELKDGRRLDTGEIRFARGNAKLPLNDEELKAKFLDCASGVKDLDAAALYERVNAIEKLDSVRDLVPHGY
jgi:2-methylcitrate dehydratase PrpD